MDFVFDRIASGRTLKCLAIVDDATHESVGPLSSAQLFDVGSPVYVKVLTAEELRQQLGLPAP
jgi:hypothetical protein